MESLGVGGEQEVCVAGELWVYEGTEVDIQFVDVVFVGFPPDYFLYAHQAERILHTVYSSTLVLIIRLISIEIYVFKERIICMSPNPPTC